MKNIKNSKLKSPWHGEFFSLQLTLGACNHHPKVRVAFRPPGHAVKILTSGRQGKKDAQRALWTPPLGNRLIQRAAISFGSGANFQNPSKTAHPHSMNGIRRPNIINDIGVGSKNSTSSEGARRIWDSRLSV